MKCDVNPASGIGERALMGQERGSAPLKAGFKPPVAFAIDRAKAVSPSLP